MLLRKLLYKLDEISIQNQQLKNQINTLNNLQVENKNNILLVLEQFKRLMINIMVPIGEMEMAENQKKI